MTNQWEGEVRRIKSPRLASPLHSKLGASLNYKRPYQQTHKQIRTYWSRLLGEMHKTASQWGPAAGVSTRKPHRRKERKTGGRKGREEDGGLERGEEAAGLLQSLLCKVHPPYLANKSHYPHVPCSPYSLACTWATDTPHTLTCVCVCVRACTKASTALQKVSL